MQSTNPITLNDTKEIINSKYVNWNEFQNKTILVTGATGLIGSKIIESFLLIKKNITILALARNKERLENMFKNEIEQQRVIPIYQDITQAINYEGSVDFIIHTACGTASKGFIETPVETINTIINVTQNIIKFAQLKQAIANTYSDWDIEFSKIDSNTKTIEVKPKTTRPINPAMSAPVNNNIVMQPQNAQNAPKEEEEKQTSAAEKKQYSPEVQSMIEQFNGKIID